ncbi:hypothetical protein, conserved in T. vivax [Trypanosoma vivax Y486]|uniref:Uncharacterized protein n=1 Tax=Trypanosoma vivax (strain Y486) TaxID=1055687 RepID=F9WQF9_TRYVY|nr:hypothetical protein, conserved in T. vivax [Trypanosoma vivax Y486]|eukprot:CCD19787.1 hypothetical protein, conserved in T. vivax [Trypanosoma vivax Y486]
MRPAAMPFPMASVFGARLLVLALIATKSKFEAVSSSGSLFFFSPSMAFFAALPPSFSSLDSVCVSSCAMHSLVVFHARATSLTFVHACVKASPMPPHVPPGACVAARARAIASPTAVSLCQSEPSSRALLAAASVILSAACRIFPATSFPSATTAFKASGTALKLSKTAHIGAKSAAVLPPAASAAAAVLAVHAKPAAMASNAVHAHISCLPSTTHRRTQEVRPHRATERLPPLRDARMLALCRSPPPVSVVAPPLFRAALFPPRARPTRVQLGTAVAAVLGTKRLSAAANRRRHRS